jgi:16S rRNA processing protein RimM
VQPRGVRLKLATVKDRNAAERLIDSLLFVDEQTRVRPESGSYFTHDLLGLRVVDQSGHEIGKMREVLKFPAHDIYVIDVRGRELMVPAVKEFITSIDLTSNTMKVKLIDGMLE